MSKLSDPGTATDPEASAGPPILLSATATSVRAAPSLPVEPVQAAERRMVVVPRRPGLLRDDQTAAPRPRDELDEFIDELFGATTEEQPGLFDAGLVLVGVVLGAWAIFLGGPGIVLWIGLAAAVLGLALPVRAVLRRYGLMRSGGLRRRIIDGGLLLDASRPVTVALVDAYAHLIQMSCLQGTGDPKRAVAAGHWAVREVAAHLDGRPPESPADIRFVTLRLEAIEGLTRQMLRAHDRWAAATADPPPGAIGIDHVDDRSQWGSLDALNRTGALAELEKLDQRLRRETTDDAD